MDEGYSLGPEPKPRLKPSNGTAVLVLGILSLVMLQPILGPIAWWLGGTSLKEIKAGRMDPTDEGIVKVGRILGMVSTGLAILGILFAIVWVFLFMPIFDIPRVIRR